MGGADGQAASPPDVQGGGGVCCEAPRGAALLRGGRLYGTPGELGLGLG